MRVLHRPKIEIPDLRRPEYEHLFRDPHLKGLADIAKANRIEMAYVQYTEQAILAGMFGNCCGMVRTAVASGATAATLNTGSLATGGASGNMDQTPNTTAVVFAGHPGASPAQNTYTNIQALRLTASAATSLTTTVTTAPYALAIGDPLFLGGSASAGGATTTVPSLGMAQQLYIGLSTAAYNTSSATILAGEPTSTGSYARIGAGTSSPATLWNNQANFPLPSAASPSVLTTAAGPWSFPASTAAWSTGATNATSMFIADALTLAGGNVLASGALGTPQAVNASGITLSFANGAITLTLT
jgi:hypothetical protein